MRSKDRFAQSAAVWRARLRGPNRELQDEQVRLLGLLVAWQKEQIETARFKLYCVEWPSKVLEANKRYFGAAGDAIRFANEKKRELRRVSDPYRYIGDVVAVHEVVTANQGRKTMLVKALNNDGWVSGASVLRQCRVWR